MVRFRKGMRQGREEFYSQTNGDVLGYYEWKDGVRSAEPLMGGELVQAAPEIHLFADDAQHYLGGT